ncbi:MAG: GntP family permease, partial [Verrucomicrobiaceae bacterium]
MIALLAATTAASFSAWPFVVLAVCVFAVIAMISWLRIHPFLALIFAALLAGVMAHQLPGGRPRGVSAAEVMLDPVTGKALRNHWTRAVELTTEEFGRTAGGVGIVIGLASIIGMCLMESGAADKVVRRALAVFGQKRAGIAIVVSSYVLSIPIFFDTMFMLMVPLAMALALRTGRDYMLYVMAICCGAVITHSLTVPHPGPLAAVDNLKIDVGFSILAG